MHIEGVVEHIQFKNEKNGYTVAFVKTQKELICCVGIMSIASEGSMIRAEGKWVLHEKYGDQFAVESCQKILPNTPKTMAAYLGSGIIKGIGKSMAEKIVEKFGLQALEIIKNDPKQLAEIKGISLKKALAYGELYKEKIQLEELTTFMQRYNVSIEVITKIYNVYGNNCLELVKSDPYSIALGEFGISFKIADKIALDCGIAQQGMTRNMAAIEFVLIDAANNGNTYCTISTLIKKATHLLGNDEQLIMQAILELNNIGRIYLIPHEQGERIYLSQYYEAEMEVSARLMHLTNASGMNLSNKDLEILISKIEMGQKIKFGETQKQAIQSCVEQGIFVITGGPGTGKTTLIKAVIEIFETLGMSVKLAAPTGRASKRMSEATGKDASTIHRMLEFVYSEESQQPFFMRNEDMPLDADVIIVDEVSMVDILLMNNLLRAIEDGTKLILVGDADQLPSVGAGNVLRDILNSKIIPSVELNTVFRQAAESMIVVNSHKINNGELPILNMKGKDFFFIEAKGAENIAKTVVDVVARRLPQTYGVDAKQDIQVLTPSRLTQAGVSSLNELLQMELNPIVEGEFLKEWNGCRFSIGDKVMQIRNNYQREWTGREKGSFEIIEGKGVFNGDMGTIVEADEKQKKLLVSFDEDKLSWYSFESLDELELAYAVTVHKSQGCEFPYIVIPISKFHHMLMTRNLIYTAITRAIKMVVLVGEKEQLAIMIKNNRELARNSSLIDFLKEYEV